ncbi:MAG: 6-phosphogluconolactonase [Cyanobacteria bacterium SZAS LIN-2]|nr:6-phosphogluconolactonase [Cyanobacteria bacterium SZAS LIN-3]MBS1995519.1 6-phosphogluconolactonase [Cyanobacteria bacterium SZAS LIN-2]MBS2006303.1 6-phosphogluconolactonase [Cyanobacteria bacterium SZAS TMP-1]
MTAQINGFGLHIAPDEDQLFADLAQSITQLANECIAKYGIFTFALSGGNTPRSLYANLAKLPDGVFPWNKTYLFLGDERCVSHDNGDSNYKMISETLLSHISIPSTNVFPTINQQKDPEEAARKYEQTIRRFFKLEAESDGAGHDKGRLPRFSLFLLGIGPDGHTASLFPGTPALDEEDRIFVANHVEASGVNRLTMTKTVIASAHRVFFLVAGEAKAQIVSDIFNKPQLNLPAQMVAQQCKKDSVEWFMDQAAASLLKPDK